MLPGHRRKTNGFVKSYNEGLKHPDGDRDLNEVIKV